MYWVELVRSCVLSPESPASLSVPATQVLLVDDHPIYTAALADVLEDAGGFRIVGTVQNGADAVAFLGTHPVDLMVVDLMLPGMSGLEIIAAALEVAPEIKIVVFSGLGTPESVQAAFGLGTCAFLEKSAPVAELIESLRAVLRGEFPLGPMASDIVRNLVRLRAKKKPLAPDDLRILRLFAENRTAKEIADEMSRSLSSIYKARDRIASRLEVKSARELAPRARALGLIPAVRELPVPRVPWPAESLPEGSN